jgi:hypothetical protein
VGVVRGAIGDGVLKVNAFKLLRHRSELVQSITKVDRDGRRSAGPQVRPSFRHPHGRVGDDRGNPTPMASTLPGHRAGDACDGAEVSTVPSSAAAYRVSNQPVGSPLAMDRAASCRANARLACVVDRRERQTQGNEDSDGKDLRVGEPRVA